MEENTEQIQKQTEKIQWEQLPWNKYDIYIPTEFQVNDYLTSWKKCHCGRKTYMNDNYCPSCGQRLGRPSIDE